MGRSLIAHEQRLSCSGARMPGTIPGTIPMAQPPRPGQPNPPPERSGTLIENPAHLPGRQPPRSQPAERSGTLDRDRRRGSRCILTSLKGQPLNPPAAAGPVGASKPSVGPAAAIFRPTVRSPVAVLTVFDDGKLDGEVIRLRSPRFVIGRTEGDLGSRSTAGCRRAMSRSRFKPPGA